MRKKYEAARVEFMAEVNRRCVPGGEHLTTDGWNRLIESIAIKHGVDSTVLRRRIY